jgi:acyl carrier protein
VLQEDTPHIDATSIEREVREFIAVNFPLSNEEFSLKPEDSLIEVGVIDSTGVLELIGFIEEHYGLEVQDAEVLPENLDSIENITRFVFRKLASTNGHATG